MFSKIAAIGEFHFAHPAPRVSKRPMLSGERTAVPGFFTYTPERFFQRLVRDFSAFCSSPSEDGVISVVLPLFHLREWLGYRPKTGMLKAECGEEGCGYTVRIASKWVKKIGAPLCPKHRAAMTIDLPEEAKPNANRTDKERLYTTLSKMPDYKIVRALCNHSKHFECQSNPLDDRMGQLHGASAGMMRSGDSLGISHFTVDGIEIRDIFWPIYRMYFDYFETCSPGLAASACGTTETDVKKV